MPALLAAARAYFATPHTFEDARDHLVSKFPRGTSAPWAMSRAWCPAGAGAQRRPVGVPGAGNFIRADTWLGKPVAACGPLAPLVLRYLSAYGPSTVKDAQAWTGLANLEPVFATSAARW